MALRVPSETLAVVPRLSQKFNYGIAADVPVGPGTGLELAGAMGSTGRGRGVLNVCLVTPQRRMPASSTMPLAGPRGGSG